MSKIPSKNIEICYDFLGQIYNLLSRCSHTPFTVLTSLYAPFYCSFARKTSSEQDEVFQL